MVSSVSLTSMILDLREKTDVADTSLRNRYYLNADIWDGFPSGKRQVLAKLAKVAEGRALVVSGDIHASFASVESGDATLPGSRVSHRAGHQLEEPEERDGDPRQGGRLRGGEPHLSLPGERFRGFVRGSQPRRLRFPRPTRTALWWSRFRQRARRRSTT